MVAGAKYVGKNVVGHDFLGQDDGNQRIELGGIIETNYGQVTNINIL